jgi:hypothetical protein
MEILRCRLLNRPILGSSVVTNAASVVLTNDHPQSFTPDIHPSLQDPMPPRVSSLTITNPLVLYRSLIATNRIQPDPAQHRLGTVHDIST